METCSAVLTFESVDEILQYDVTIQMKPLWQNFGKIPSVLNILQNEI